MIATIGGTVRQGATTVIGPVLTIPSICEKHRIETKRGNLAVPPFVNLLCRPGSAQIARMFRERRAPQERCVQLWCSSKPGGVIVPPELRELTPRFYALDLSNASEELVNIRNPQMSRRRSSKDTPIELLDEERFAQLVAAHERFHRPVAAKEVLNLAILINLLRRTDDRR
jgi:hypothetical protein